MLAEQVLGVFQCIVRKQPSSVYVTSDRILFHVVGTAAEDAQVIFLNKIVGFVMNKPRPEIPPQDQKALIKVQFREGDSLELRDRVIDFTGDDRFSNAVACEKLLRENAGDKAEERRIHLKRLDERRNESRRKFLEDNPQARASYMFLTSPQGGGLSEEEFWHQYKSDLIEAFGTSEQDLELNKSIPVPLRRPDLLSSDVSANMLLQSTAAEKRSELAVTPERAEEIFAQFPKARELYSQLVPHSLSEKNFWKRFFQSQFFLLSQGNPVQGAKEGGRTDTVFDLLADGGQKTRKYTRPGELAVDPEIDLCLDYCIKDDGVFGDKPVGEKYAETDAVPHAVLINRFNAFSAKTVEHQSFEPTSAGDSSDALSESLRKRTQYLDQALESDPVRIDLCSWAEHEQQTAAAVSKQELERLRKSRRKIDLTLKSDLNNYSSLISGTTNSISVGMEGVAKTTVDLTTELVTPSTSGSTVSTEAVRKTKRLSFHPESSELNEYVERITELAKFFYSTNMKQQDKRTKLIHALSKVKSELSNTFAAKSKIPNEWMGTISMLNSVVANIEVINANLMA